ncbi:MAG: hypothetical protein ACRDA5_04935 [Clostridium sp.]
MMKKCLRCNTEMKVADLGVGGAYALLEQRKKGFQSKVCGVDAYVCPNCGYVELVAEKPEIFNEK